MPVNAYKAMIEAMTDGVAILDESDRIRFANTAMAEMVRRESTDSLLDRAWSDFFPVDKEFGAQESKCRFEALLVSEDGETVPVLVSRTGLKLSGGRKWTMAVVKDITDFMREEAFLLRKHQELDKLVKERTGELTKMTEALKQEVQARVWAQEKVQHMAYHDSLTDLPNRYLFFDRLQQALYQAARFIHHVVVYYIDLDDFKTINDKFGHAVGDDILWEASQRIQNCLRKTDTVARIGGDEFAVILPDVSDVEYAEEIVKKLVAAMAEPILIKGNETKMSVSVGISVYPEHGNEPFELLKRADAAMYHVKKTGKNGYGLYGSDTVDEELPEDVDPAGWKAEREVEKARRLALSREGFAWSALGDVVSFKELERRKTTPTLSSMVGVIADSVLVFDLMGNCVSVNETFANLFGLRVEDFQNKHFMELPGMKNQKTEDIDAYMRMFMKTVQTGRADPVELNIVRWDGRELKIQVEGRVIRDARGKPTHLMTTLHEIRDEEERTK